MSKGKNDSSKSPLVREYNEIVSGKITGVSFGLSTATGKFSMVELDTPLPKGWPKEPVVKFNIPESIIPRENLKQNFHLKAVIAWSMPHTGYAYAKPVVAPHVIKAKVSENPPVRNATSDWLFRKIG